MALIKCPECGNAVSTNAAMCIKCGFVINNQTANPKSPGVAVVLNFIWSGVGNLFIGEIGFGIFACLLYPLLIGMCYISYNHTMNIVMYPKPPIGTAGWAEGISRIFDDNHLDDVKSISPSGLKTLGMDGSFITTSQESFPPVEIKLSGNTLNNSSSASKKPAFENSRFQGQWYDSMGNPINFKLRFIVMASLFVVTFLFWISLLIDVHNSAIKLSKGNSNYNVGVFSIHCPHCRQKLDIPSSYAGQTGQCPACSKTFMVPKVF